MLYEPCISVIQKQTPVALSLLGDAEIRLYICSANALALALAKHNVQFKRKRSRIK